MSRYQERPNRFPWPPVILLVTLVAAIVLHRFVPLSVRGSGVADELLRFGGVVLFAAAVALYVTAARAMMKAKTNILPHRAAEHLVTSGPFAISRNPIYLANVLALTGFGLFFGNGWLVILAFIGGFAEQKLAIEREEAHLEAKFGAAWRSYKKKVRRWI